MTYNLFQPSNIVHPQDYRGPMPIVPWNTDILLKKLRRKEEYTINGKSL